MGSYVAGRLLLFVPTIVGVTTIVFLLLHLMPGDPVDVMLGETATAVDRAELRAELGLERPLAIQYASFLGGLVRGDLGHSIRSRRPVASLIGERLPSTLLLALAAMAAALALGIPAGVMAARRPHGIFDRTSLALSMLGVAIPNFWLGPMLILVFAVELDFLPVSGSGGPAHVVLPAITLGAAMAGILARMTRTAVLESLREDYVRTARAKGLSEVRVLIGHALRNALTPLLSVASLQFGALLGGSLITETIFAWPGLGRLTMQAIEARDYPMVQGCVLTIALTYVVVNLATDIAYARINPRIRYDDDA